MQVYKHPLLSLVRVRLLATRGRASPYIGGVWIHQSQEPRMQRRLVRLIVTAASLTLMLAWESSTALADSPLIEVDYRATVSAADLIYRLSLIHV